MTEFNYSKLYVIYLPYVTEYKPVAGRKYTLTHSDDTGDLFLSIGFLYDDSVINKKNRDEVLAEWIPQFGHYILKGKVHITEGEFNEQMSKIRFMIFQRELHLALSAIAFGDCAFYQTYPELLNSPIYIQFISSFPQFNQLKYFGTLRNYVTA